MSICVCVRRRRREAAARVPRVTLSLSLRVLKRLRGVRSVRAYAAVSYSSCRDARCDLAS